jgi:glutathione S-transferase
MDSTSTPFPSPGGLVHGIDNNHLDSQLDHQLDAQLLHHHVSAAPPPSLPHLAGHHFALSGLPAHGNIGLGVLDFHHPHSVSELQHLQPGPAIPILRPQRQQLDEPPPPGSAPPQPPSLTVPPPPPPPPPSAVPVSAPPTTAAATPSTPVSATGTAPIPSPTRAQPHGASSVRSGSISHGQYGLTPIAPNIVALQQEDDFLAHSMGQPASASPDSAEARPHGQLVNRIVVDPPNLDAWRDKLFHVDDTILLTNEEFEIYFPHIDNVYSHRSTQKYKRKPFVSHYWDCRMKGRPPGTPKSNDPLKKKRKRSARERDLCDVKIKITEYFPGATLQLDEGMGAYSSPQQFYDAHGMAYTPGANGEKFWTIQRVNGNGGNGKGDGVAGPHKHTLAKSDEIKKSTVQRFINAQKKEAKKTPRPPLRKATGLALATVRRHTKEHELKLYASCFW